MLSTKPPTTAEPIISPVTPASSLSPISSAAYVPSDPITPTSTRPPTSTNSAMKKASVDHSTSSRNASALVCETTTIAPAPSMATSDGSRWSSVCRPKASITKARTARQR